MKDFKEIIVRLKLHLGQSKECKVRDKDVAELLGINQARFATIKKRNVTPYEELLLFCERENKPCKELFFS